MRRVVAIIFFASFVLSILSCESQSKVDDRMQLIEGKYIMKSWVNLWYSDNDLISTVPNSVKKAEVIKEGKDWYFHFVMTGIDERSEYLYREINTRIIWNQVLCCYCIPLFSDSDFGIDKANDNVELLIDEGSLYLRYDYNTIRWERDI